MPVFAYSIAADQDRPSEGDGFVRAETIHEAVVLVGHPEVNVYSPDLNPIEMVFAKLRALLRKAAQRTEGALSERIGQLLKTYTPKECSNYLTHAGYDRA